MIKTNKILAIGLAIGISCVVATTSYAENFSDVTPLAMVDPGGGGRSDLDVDMSPGVIMSIGTAANAFNLATKNLNAKSDLRIQYGIHSAFSGYYQLVQADDTISVTGATMETDAQSPVVDSFGIAGAGWVAISGGT